MYCVEMLFSGNPCVCIFGTKCDPEGWDTDLVPDGRGNVKKMRAAIEDMSIRKKIILYAYIGVVPLLFVICIMVTIYRYVTSCESYVQLQKDGISSLASSLEIIQKEAETLSLNMAVSQDIQNILKCQTPEILNQDVKMWVNNAPVQMLEENIALKGYVKTISVYPENGIVPYLKCIDSTSYIPTMEQLRETSIYQETAALCGEGVWRKEGKGTGEIYYANRSEKLILCREVYDFLEQKPLGFITVGIQEEKIRSLCYAEIKNEEEGIILYDRRGMYIASYGEVSDQTRQYIQQKNLESRDTFQGEFEGKEIYITKASVHGWYVGKILPEKEMSEKG